MMCLMLSGGWKAFDNLGRNHFLISTCLWDGCRTIFKSKSQANGKYLRCRVFTNFKILWKNSKNNSTRTPCRSLWAGLASKEYLAYSKRTILTDHNMWIMLFKLISIDHFKLIHAFSTILSVDSKWIYGNLIYIFLSMRFFLCFGNNN